MSSGFKVETIKEGNGFVLIIIEYEKIKFSFLGQKPKVGQRVSVHYTGKNFVYRFGVIILFK